MNLRLSAHQQAQIMSSKKVGSAFTVVAFKAQAAFTQ